MAALVIKNLPDELHRKLKARAARHHRSMTREAIMQLERALSEPDEADVRRVPPEPLDVGFRPDDKWLYKAIREGRE